MFEGLQKKWKVGAGQLLLILCTFAIGGSLTGYLGRKLLNLFTIDSRVLWVVLYVIVVTLIWPFAVLLISIPFGQYRFFTNYLKKLGKRMKLISADEKTTPIRIAIFASGAGSNAKKIIEYFSEPGHLAVEVALIACNKPEAGVLHIAAENHIPTLIIEKEQFFRGDGFVPFLKENGVDFIVLAGFLWKIPSSLINSYPGKIINIHPALLPKFGGKGMYGKHVHEAVIAAGETESGITIHYVDEKYDHGATILQATCPVYSTDTAETLAARIHELEHAHFPKAVEACLRSGFA